MPRAEIEALRHRYEAAGRKDLGAIFRDAHPDFELKTADRAPNAGTYRGAEAATRYYQDLAEPFEEVTYQTEEFFERGDRILVFLVARFRPKGSSAVVTNRIAALWTVQDGQFARCEMFARRMEALAAGGLTEGDRVTL